MDNKPVVKYGLPALGVAFYGVILLSLAFTLSYLIDSSFDYLFQSAWNQTIPWHPPVKHLIFLGSIAAISWFVLKSKFKEYYKIIYLTVPTAVIFTYVGVSMYLWPVLSHIIGAVIYGSILYYFHLTRKPWLYYFSVSLVTLVLVIMGLLGVDI